MPIPFPKLHIAASVLNRISNTLEEQGPLGLSNKQPAAPALQMPPIAPNPEALGAQLNQAVVTPPAQIGVPPEMETDANTAMVEASALGASPFDGLLVGAAGE